MHARFALSRSGYPNTDQLYDEAEKLEKAIRQLDTQVKSAASTNREVQKASSAVEETFLRYSSEANPKRGTNQQRLNDIADFQAKIERNQKRVSEGGGYRRDLFTIGNVALASTSSTEESVERALKAMKTVIDLWNANKQSNTIPVPSYDQPLRREDYPENLKRRVVARVELPENPTNDVGL